MIKIQATFIGYGGKACSLFSAIDEDSKILVISAEADYRTERRDGCIVLTNDRDITRDSLFCDEHIKDAISAFYSLKAGIAVDGVSPRLVFSERAARANPEASIEKDGIDPTGPRYRIAESVSCGQMAVLATCLYAIKADTVKRTIQMFDDLSLLNGGHIITI